MVRSGFWSDRDPKSAQCEAKISVRARGKWAWRDPSTPLLVGVKLRDDGLAIWQAVCRLGVHLVEWLGRMGSYKIKYGRRRGWPQRQKKPDFWFSTFQAELGAGVLTYALSHSG